MPKFCIRKLKEISNTPYILYKRHNILNKIHIAVVLTYAICVYHGKIRKNITDYLLHRIHTENQNMYLIGRYNLRVAVHICTYDRNRFRLYFRRPTRRHSKTLTHPFACICIWRALHSRDFRVASTFRLSPGRSVRGHKELC